MSLGFPCTRPKRVIPCNSILSACLLNCGKRLPSLKICLSNGSNRIRNCQFPMALLSVHSNAVTSAVTVNQMHIDAITRLYRIYLIHGCYAVLSV